MAGGSVNLWVSSNRLGTCAVQVDDTTKRIVATAPIWRKFVGQPLDRLLGWIEKVEHEKPLVESLGSIRAPAEVE